MGLFTYNCQKAMEACDKAQYNEATFVQILQYKMHTFICNRCKSYAKNNKKLTKIIKKSKVEVLDKESKSKLQKVITTNLQK